MINLKKWLTNNPLKNLSSNPMTSAIGNGGITGGTIINRTGLLLIQSNSKNIGVDVALAKQHYYKL